MATPSVVDVGIGGMVAILLIDRVFNFIKGMKNGSNGNGICKAGEQTTTIHSISKSIEKLTEIEKRQQTLMEQVVRQSDALHDAHLGPRAIDARGGLRWHGTEVTEELRELRRVLIDQTDRHGKMVLGHTASLAKALKEAIRESK